jgi:hypothetical protein
VVTWAAAAEGTRLMAHNINLKTLRFVIGVSRDILVEMPY